MEPKLYEEYVEDGTLRIEWRDFPYRGRSRSTPPSPPGPPRPRAGSGSTTTCSTTTSPRASATRTSSRSPRRPASTCSASREIYENARYDELVQADFQEGQSIGVNGTPTFFINDQVLVGLQPIGVFERAIEDARREAEGG